MPSSQTTVVLHDQDVAAVFVVGNGLGNLDHHLCMGIGDGIEPVTQMACRDHFRALGKDTFLSSGHDLVGTGKVRI